MLKLSFLASTLAGLFVYAVSTYATYDAQIRASRKFWVIGAAAALIAQLLWTWLAQSTNDQRRVMTYALIWDAGFAVVSVLVPVLLHGLRLSVWGYVALALIGGGGLLLKEFGFSG
jgi:hypothetical protein